METFRVESCLRWKNEKFLLYNKISKTVRNIYQINNAGHFRIAISFRTIYFFISTIREFRFGFA